MVGQGLIKKGEIFSEFNEDHSNELKIIFEVLYYAKKFDAFYNAAAWARQNVNCGVFIDAALAAIFHRRDTNNVVIPPPYELLPNYFISKNVILKGKLLLETNEITTSDDVHVEGNVYTIDANYTADITDNEDESRLAYFLEDIGLNSYYFLKRIINQYQNKSGTYSNRGEYWYHYIKQLLARYDLERYSNGFPLIQEVSLNDLFSSGYNSKLMYSDGHDFSIATIPESTENIEKYNKLKNIEASIELDVKNLVSIFFHDLVLI